MTLVECCEPLFQYVCRLNRSARKGASPEMAQVRADITGILSECRARAAANKLAEPYDRIEIILIYFTDFMVRESRLTFARQWQDLAQERNKQGGDEDFFDQLDETLKDTSEGATQRLAVFYTCIGLGFTGWYTGQPEYLRKKMLEIASRLRGMMDADRSAKICPESYEYVNTADLVQPPSRKLVGVAIVLLGLAVTLFAANVVMYMDKRSKMLTSLKALETKQAEIIAGSKGGAR